MQLTRELERLAEAEESLFRRQLLREDVARLHRLEALRGSSPDFAAFRKAGLRLGWTQADARTSEIAAELESLLQAVYAGEDLRITEAWNALHRARMERLLGCLATPAPKPAE
jgi:hypothetical protein